MLPVTSRYYGLPTSTFVLADGRTVAYVQRRFLPDSEKFTTLTEHLVTQGERLDNITARYLGDPEQFWRVCDANTVKNPDELTDEARIGQRIRIPLPQGG